jgi:hypothetical protein
MRVVVRQEPVDRTALAWWAALGVGLGLVLLSTVLWLRQGSPDDENLAFSRELARIEPVLLQLHRGELPSPENLDKSRTGEFEPLMRALIDAARQRQQALEAYQSQVEACHWVIGSRQPTWQRRKGGRVCALACMSWMQRWSRSSSVTRPCSRTWTRPCPNGWLCSLRPCGPIKRGGVCCRHPHLQRM